jgi:branched-chain amino acid transport system substrate-binding protein
LRLLPPAGGFAFGASPASNDVNAVSGILPLVRSLALAAVALLVTVTAPAARDGTAPAARDGTASAAGAQPAAAEPSPIRIAVLNDRQGIYSRFGGEGSVVAARLAVEEMTPFLNGRRVEILVGDHRNDPATAIDLIDTWRTQPGGLQAVADVPNSAVALAVQDVARETGLVHLNVSAAAPDLTGRSCAETGVHWAFDTYALAVGTGQAVVAGGGKTWFFVTADYVFGHRLEADASAAVAIAGGRVLGSQRHPFANVDFVPYLQAARASGADVVALANAGADTVAALRAAATMPPGGPRVVSLLVFLSDIETLGLEAAQGLTLTTAWYWDRDDRSRAFAHRFAERFGGRMPTMAQAGTYSAVRHYLRGLIRAGRDDGPAVIAAMRALPVDDAFATGGRLRRDGRMVHDMYLAQVKSPAESRGPGDYYRLLRVIPGDLAFRPLQADVCSLAGD